MMGYSETHQKPKNKIPTQKTKLVTLYAPFVSNIKTILPVIPPSSTPQLSITFSPVTPQISETISSRIYIAPITPQISTISYSNDSIPYNTTNSSNTSQSAPYNGCGTNFYQNWIYEEESGCDPTKVNSMGCIGIGQDCNGVLVTLCPTLTYSCENQYFTNYMISRYGSWQNAYNFHIANGWW